MHKFQDFELHNVSLASSDSLHCSLRVKPKRPSSSHSCPAPRITWTFLTVMRAENEVNSMDQGRGGGRPCSQVELGQGRSLCRPRALCSDGFLISTVTRRLWHAAMSRDNDETGRGGQHRNLSSILSIQGVKRHRYLPEE